MFGELIFSITKLEKKSNQYWQISAKVLMYSAGDMILNCTVSCETKRQIIQDVLSHRTRFCDCLPFAAIRALSKFSTTANPSLYIYSERNAAAPGPRPAHPVQARAGRDSAASGAAQTNRCLLISSSHEKRTAIKQRASRDREFYVNES